MTTAPAIDRIRRRTGEGGVGFSWAVLSFVILAAAGAIGMALTQPWLFPSMGPTVMLMFGSADHPSSRPLNAFVGHAVGIVVGVGCLFLFGMEGKPSAPVAGLSVGYVLAASLSVALTMLILQLIKLPHAPAGATTMIISLGVIATPLGILSMAGALAFTILATFGLSWLLWRPKQPWKEEQKEPPKPVPAATPSPAPAPSPEPASGQTPGDADAPPAVRRRDIRRS
jgi:CBS-domain-containing membrane protein